MITYGSTFTGILGLDRAFEQVLGARCSWACECSAYCREIIWQRAGGDLRVVPDVRAVGRQSVPRADAIIGGFPCQDVSDAGGRRGLAHGERTGLWHELARCVDELRPDLVFFENVRGLVGRGLDHVLADLAALGFDASWSCVRAADVGAPHRRERIFILGWTDAGRERLADAHRQRLRQLAEWDLRGQAERRNAEPLDVRAHDVGDAAGPQRGRRVVEDGSRSRARGEGVADAARERHAREGARRGGRATEPLAEPSDGRVAVADRVHDRRRELGPRDDDDRRDAPGHELDRRNAAELRDHRWPPGPADQEGWARWPGARPSFRRSPDGLPRWVDRARLAEGLRRARLRALGNAVVSQQAAYALQTLVSRALCG